MPRSPTQAKGLLLAAIACPDPVIFMEPKALYRAAVEQVPTGSYTLPLSIAQIIKPGSDLTLISYGQPLYTCSSALAAAEKDLGLSIELIDLRTIYPFDRSTVLASARKTGRVVVVHESMLDAGVGAEIAATIQDAAFLRLEAPVQRVAGWSTHTGLVYESFNLPDVVRKFFSPFLFVFLSPNSVMSLTGGRGLGDGLKGFMMPSNEQLSIEFLKKKKRNEDNVFFSQFPKRIRSRAARLYIAPENEQITYPFTSTCSLRQHAPELPRLTINKPPNPFRT